MKDFITEDTDYLSELGNNSRMRNPLFKIVLCLVTLGGFPPSRRNIYYAVISKGEL